MYVQTGKVNRIKRVMERRRTAVKLDALILTYSTNRSAERGRSLSILLVIVRVAKIVVERLPEPLYA